MAKLHKYTVKIKVGKKVTRYSFHDYDRAFSYAFRKSFNSTGHYIELVDNFTPTGSKVKHTFQDS